MNHQPESLFETVRELPVELSLPEVEVIIATLPTATSKIPWYQQIHLNTIIMTLTATALLLGGLWWSSVQEIPAITEKSLTPTLLVAESSPSDLSTIETLPIMQIGPSPMAAQIAEPSGQGITYFLPRVSSDKIEYNVRSNEYAASNGGQRRENLFLAGQVVKPDSIEKHPHLNLKGTLGGFKRQLRRQARKDGLIKEKNHPFNLSYRPGQVLLNGSPLDAQLQSQYIAIFKDRNLVPGPHREVHITKDFIKVGDLDERGFFGKGYGTFRDDTFNQGTSAGLLNPSEKEAKVNDLFGNSMLPVEDDSLKAYYFRFQALRFKLDEKKIVYRRMRNRRSQMRKRFSRRRFRGLRRMTSRFEENKEDNTLDK